MKESPGLRGIARTVGYFGLLVMLCVVIGCGSSHESAVRELTGPTADSGLTGEVRSVANKALGQTSTILLSGDLAQNGRLQVLAEEGLGRRDAASTDGVEITRAVVLERQKSSWVEVLRCDEYLKNPKGFLEGAPQAPVTGWQLQIRQGAKKNSVRDLYFTPLQSGKPVEEATVAVRWNAQAGRYQAHKADGEFLGEVVSLDIPGSELR